MLRWAKNGEIMQLVLNVKGMYELLHDDYLNIFG